MATKITLEEHVKQVNNIKAYLYDSLIPPMSGLFEECIKAKENMHNLSKEQKITLVTLASYWSALIRRTYKLYVLQLGYTHNVFWDAFIQVFVLHQRILLDYNWKPIIDNDFEFKEIINSTVFPKWIYKMFVGIDLHWLVKEMEKFVTNSTSK